MKKFHFQLDTVLRYKEQVLDTRLAEHGVVVAQVIRQEQVLADAEALLHTHEEEYRRKKCGGLTVLEAMEYENGLTVLERTRQREEEKLLRLRELEEQKRARVVEAKQETSSLEKLKEIKRREYNSALAKEEEKFIDDLVMARRAANAS